MWRPALALILIAALPVPLSAGEPAPAPDKPSPEFERVKALAGEWQGSAQESGVGKALPTQASIRVVSAGSAVMLVTDPGTPHEMVTMFHRDDDGLVATHYCSGMNQPRMRAVLPAEPGKLTFEFADGTNLRAHPGHMQRLVLSIVDGTHHVQEWTFVDGNAMNTMVFKLARAK